MSDVNVMITAVDKGMDILDGCIREIEDLCAHAVFEIQSVIDEVRLEKSLAEQETEKLDRLCYQSAIRGAELESQWRGLCGQMIDLAEDCKRVMADYIRSLNRIREADGTAGVLGGGHGPDYHVVIVDSGKYPQTAEHIRRAQRMGLPEFVTLGRADAAERRSASLAEVKASSIYDRDEWPMAVFAEGGQGANVFYVDGRDNRGAGASIGWQMRGFPDGSRVRVRVI